MLTPGTLNTLRQDWTTRHTVGCLGYGLLGLVPLLVGVSKLLVFMNILFLMLFAVSWDFISGYTGEISLGHAIFFGCGGYTTTVLNLTYNIDPLVSIPVGIVVATAAGLVIGFPALRVKGPYLSLLTLIMLLSSIQLVITFNETLGGISGFGVPVAAIAGTGSDSIITVSTTVVGTLITYYIVYVIVFLVYLLLYIITRSHIGKILSAIREDERVVSATGHNPAKYKLYAFTVSAAVGGLAGALYVHSPVGITQPAEILSVERSLNIIIMVIIGGVGTIVGSAVGATLFGGINLIGQVTIPILDQTVSETMPLPAIIAAVVVIRTVPEGIVPRSITIGQRILSRFDNVESPSDDTTYDNGRQSRSALRAIMQKNGKILRRFLKSSRQREDD